MRKNVGKSFKARYIPLKILLICQFTLRYCNYHQTNYKSEKWNFVEKLNFWLFLVFPCHRAQEKTLHMCPLKNFDTRWYYKIYKLSQKHYLIFFGLQKNTFVDNYGGGSSGTHPPFFTNREHFRKNNLDWMKTIKKEKFTWWS